MVDNTVNRADQKAATDQTMSSTLLHASVMSFADVVRQSVLSVSREVNITFMISVGYVLWAGQQSQASSYVVLALPVDTLDTGHSTGRNLVPGRVWIGHEYSVLKSYLATSFGQTAEYFGVYSLLWASASSYWHGKITQKVLDCSCSYQAVHQS